MQDKRVALEAAHPVPNRVDFESVVNLRTATIILSVLVGIFAAGASWLALRDEQARQLKSLTALAEIGAQSLDAYFAGLQGAMGLVSEDLLEPDGSVDGAKAASALRRLKAAFPELRIATLAQLDGTIIASTEKIDPGSGATMAAQQTFVIAREERLRTGNRNLTIGRAFFGPLSREWVAPLGFGVWDRQGRLRLILGAGLPLSRPQALWKDAPLPERAAFGIVREDGFLLLRNPLPPKARLEEVYGKRASGAMAAYLLEAPRANRGHVVGRSLISGEDTLFVYRRLASFPLTFYVANPTWNTYAGWWERIWPAWLLLLALVLAGNYAYRWALGRQAAWEGERALRIRLLEEANQELEDFAYTVAHDLKSPARAIDGHAGIAIASEPALSEGARHRFTQIRRNAARMGELIDDLLEFSRYSRTAVVRRTLDMEALAREVSADVVPADGGIDLSIGPLPPCEADPALVRVVWTALLSNAVKYSANAPHPSIEVGFDAGKYFVRDNGVGFDMAHSDKLFSVFTRLHGADEFEGTGAGLAIARRIVERHGGSISAEASPGQGAVFRFSVS